MRRNVYALEEAGLVHRDGKRGAAAALGEESRTGGNGPLDSSWLNARSSDSVSKGMDREIWTEARRFVERVEAQKSGAQETNAQDNMEVDNTAHG